MSLCVFKGSNGAYHRWPALRSAKTAGGTGFCTLRCPRKAQAFWMVYRELAVLEGYQGRKSCCSQGSTVLLFHTFLPPLAELLISHYSSEESSSSVIETVAYILLAHISKPDLAFNEASVSKLVRWLSGQRNAFGGLASTQVISWGKERNTVSGMLCTSLIHMSL